MKTLKLSSIIIAVAALLGIGVFFTARAGQTTTKIICPPSVSCNCVLKQTPSKKWFPDSDPVGRCTTTTTYKFYHALWQESGKSGGGSCDYGSENNRMITFQSGTKSSQNVRPWTSNSKWKSDGSTPPDTAYDCYSHDPNDCPFVPGG